MNASWVAIDLMEFAVRTEDAVQSPEAALEWLRSFRDTLLMEGRNSRPMPWAVELLGMADVKIAKKSIARMQGQIVKIYGKDCNVDLECSKKYGEKYEKLKKILAATTSDYVDESTTGCNQINKRPDASVGNAEEVVTNDSSKWSRAICTSATSGQTFEALEQAGAGEVPPESVSAKPSPALPVLSFGEFGNIKMTNMQYAKLCERFSIADSVLAEADQYFEAQPSKKKKYKNHYAMLLNWCKRRETESKPKQGYKTAADRDREEIQKIADYYAAQERGEKPPMPKIQLVEGL